MLISFQRRAVVLVGICAAASHASAQITFNINLSLGRSAISPLIYGINTNNTGGVANPGLAQSAYQNLNLTFERLGGDRWTAYNYTNNASNAGSDYYYESDNYLGGGSTPAGAVLPFLQGASGGGAIVTVPINGYVAADESGQMTPGSTVNTTHFVPEYPTSAQDPSPASNHVYQNNFVQLIKNAFPGTPSRPLVFDLDNEPDLWDSSHPEVHPSQTTYSELLSDTVAYATMIKSIAPSALVYGPVSYGWDGFTTLQDAPDSGANGDFLTYYLQHMSAASSTAGVRLLDALDLHWYPEATGNNASGNATRIIGDDTSPGVVAARVQAPRSLWDSTYVETSYITQDEGYGAINLINREQAKINAYYPGTKFSFGEYNYGAGGDISGAIAQADVLGIFGKYGIYSANEWPLDNTQPFIDGAFRMFRNYDGNNSTFGDTEVQALNSDTVNSSVYASVDSTNTDHLTLIVINKKSSATTAVLNISNGGLYKTAAVYQLTNTSSGSGSVPTSAGNITLTNPAAFNYSMPAYSVSVISLLSNQWLLSTGGSWNSTTSWSAGIPDGQSAQANFLAAPSGMTSAGTVTLDGNHTVGQISFNNSNSYTIAAGTGGTLTINDTGDTTGANPSIAVQAGSHTMSAPISLANGVTVSTVNGSSLTLSGNVNGSGGMTVTGGGTFTLGGADTFTGTISVSSGASLFVTGSVASTAVLTANGSTSFNASIGAGVLVRTLSSLSIGSSGQLHLAPASNHSNRTLLILTAGFTLSGSTNGWSGKLDLSNNDMDVQTGSIATLNNQVGQGFRIINSGIYSSDTTLLTTLGVIQNNQGGTPIYGSGTNPISFDGTNPAPADILIKYTYFGDTNLDGKVDGSDYSRIDSGYLNQTTSQTTGWYNGDFNYDGVINGSDYTLIDNAFNTQGTGLNAAIVNPVAGIVDEIAVPEPSLAFIFGAMTLAAHLRHRRPGNPAAVSHFNFKIVSATCSYSHGSL